jgi:hypothetical protein
MLKKDPLDDVVGQRGDLVITRLVQSATNLLYGINYSMQWWR